MVKLNYARRVRFLGTILLLPLLLAGCPQDPNCSGQSDSDSSSDQCQNQDGTNGSAKGFQASNPISVPLYLGISKPITTMAVQSDGKILYAGGTGTVDSQPVIARYNSDGTIDSSFGASGFATADYGNISFFQGVAVQLDGKIVAAGGTLSFESILVRFNSDGSLDSSFTPTVKSNDVSYPGFYFPLIQADGKILATNLNQIYRFNSDGTTDIGFANAGHTNSFVQAIALQSNQKIIGCGATNSWSGPNSYLHFENNSVPTLMRLNSDGSADGSFGSSGVVPITLFGARPCDAVAIQADGKILIGGNFWFANSGSPNTLDSSLIYMIRFNSDGSLDTSFATGGTLVYSMPRLMLTESLTSILILPNGNIFAAGAIGTLELNSNGTINSAYTSPISVDTQWGIAAAALLPSGDIVMGWSGFMGKIYLIKP